MNKRITFSFGTFASLIIIFFIYLFSKGQKGFGWSTLKFLSQWYLIIFLGFIVLGLLVFLILTLIILGFFLYAKLSHNKKDYIKKKKHHILEAEYTAKKPEKKEKFEM